MTNSEHDDKGLYEKYIVLKEACGLEEDGVLHFHEDTENGVLPEGLPILRKKTPCFVLSPEKRDDYGNASRVALEAYAMVIEKQNPALAKDLRDWIIKILANMVDELEKAAPWLAISPDVNGEKPMEIGLIDPATDKMWSGTRKGEYKKLGDAEESDVAVETMAESIAEAEDERILKALKEKLADERFARRVTEIQRDAALSGRDRLLREKLKLPGEDQQDAEAMGDKVPFDGDKSITENTEPSKHEQVVTCECGWTGTVEKPKTLHMVDIECPECEGTIRLEEDDGLDEG